MLAAIALVTAATAALPATAQAAAGSSFVTFREFLGDMAQTRYSSAVANGRAGVAAGPQAFDQMRWYAMDMYRGVEVTHSYLVDEGYFDCVTVESQPSLRGKDGKQLPTPPEPSASDAKPDPSAKAADSPLTLGLRDAFGNAVSCAAGTIPMQRISLDRMTRFATVQEFLAKKPGGAGSGGGAEIQATRQYAYGYQNVNNHGGNSILNLWNPSANFSISQQWFSTGSGSTTQTVEGGWIKYPAKFGNSSVTFIFFTPNNYASGCYNLDCSGFVQTNSNWALGGAWSAYSVIGGAQYIFTMQWKWYQGNWWLYLKGSGAIEAVGYYPGSVFNGGAMATAAVRSLYGGETAPNGATWPPMGSGRFASGGFAQAAYQRNIFYISTADVSVWNSLTPVATAPSCYTIAYTPSSSGGSWGTYFYFGGPGGTC